VEEHEEVAPSKTRHDSGQDTVALSRRLFGDFEEELEHRVVEKAAGYVNPQNPLVSDGVFTYRLDEHGLVDSAVLRRRRLFCISSPSSEGP
jgi:hypothetical protein